MLTMKVRNDDDMITDFDGNETTTPYVALHLMAIRVLLIARSFSVRRASMEEGM